ncbi:zf-HC2 domain-containing protein [bacterium]|nr:zf-HC2 domain-containing protein [bacterium]
MKCKDIKYRLSAFMDGRAGPDEAAEIESHLRICPDCGAVRREMRQVTDLLGLLPDAAPEPFFTTRLAARLAQDHAADRHPRVRRFLVPLYMVSALVVGFIIGSFSGSLFNGAQTTSSTEDAMARSLYLQSFDDFPEASISEAYFTLAVNLTDGEGDQP